MVAAARHRRKPEVHTRWLRAAAVTAGLGAAVATGQGIASADTADASDSGAAADHSAKASAATAEPSTKQATARPSVTGPRLKSATAKGRPDPTAPAKALFDSLLVAVRPTQHVAHRRPAAAQVTTSGPDRDIAEPVAADPTALTEIRSRSDVSVQQHSDGTVRVIDGTFTSTTVTTAADAASVLNEVAPLLGTRAGFATVDQITMQQVGTTDPESSDLAETFYRFHDSVDGVPVVGSEVILVANGSGSVTGLFNNLDTRAGTVSTTPDARVNTSSEAAAAALTAYVSSTSGEPFSRSLSALLAAPTVKPELVVYALDPDAAPRLAWKVVVDPSATLRPLGVKTPNPGTTYYIYANGTDAGSVITEFSNAQPASVPAISTGTDALGQTRELNVARTTLFIFNIDTLQDLSRDIATYQTTYQFFGLGPPSLPGKPVRQGLFGWDTSAVSAQANIVTVYDYYDDMLGLTSFDGDGAPIDVSIRYNPRTSIDNYFLGYNNAFWDPDAQQIVFGNAGEMDAALDIVAHEYTHAVVSYAVGEGDSPLSEGESGALNEAYADILGSLIEGKSGTDRWLIGEDSDGGPIRNLAVPGAIAGYRTTYANRYTGTDDNGGEHYNSTIFSHAAYEMMTDDRTQGISEETWAKVYYHSLYRLSPGATFADGRAAVLSTAGQPEFGFTDAQLQAIEDAFDDVGIVGANIAV